MEKKSALIGGGIGLAVGMASMFGLVLGIGSCAGSQNVKKADYGPLLVERPKLEKVPESALPVFCYRLSVTEDLTLTTQQIQDMTEEVDFYVYYDYRESLGGPPVTTGVDAELKTSTFVYNSNQPTGYMLFGLSRFGQSGSDTWTCTVSSFGMGGVRYLSTLDFGNDALEAYIEENMSVSYGALSYDADNQALAFEELPLPAEPGNVVTDIFAQVVSSISSFGQALGSSVSAITSAFYQDGNFTMLGYLTLITGGVALVYWVFYFLKSSLRIGVK